MYNVFKEIPEVAWQILDLSEKIDELIASSQDAQNEVSGLRTELASHKGHKPVTVIDVQLHEQKVKNLKTICNDSCSKIDTIKDEIIVLKDKLKIVEAAGVPHTVTPEFKVETLAWLERWLK